MPWGHSAGDSGSVRRRVRLAAAAKLEVAGAQAAGIAVRCRVGGSVAAAAVQEEAHTVAVRHLEEADSAGVFADEREGIGEEEGRKRRLAEERSIVVAGLAGLAVGHIRSSQAVEGSSSLLAADSRIQTFFPTLKALPSGYTG